MPIAATPNTGSFLDLKDLRLLLELVELGSIQRAAQRFGMPRSTLRRRLEDLESRVGSELVVRSSGGVALTYAGAVVCSEGRLLLERSERMVLAARSAMGQSAGPMVVVVPVGIPEALSLSLLRGLDQLLPGACTEQIERAEPLDHLHEPFDLMLHFGAPPSRGQWFSQTVARLRLVPLASEAYLAKHGRPASAADLATHRLLSWQIGRSNPREWPLLSGGVVRVEPMAHSRNGQLMHRAAQEGVGILLGSPAPAFLPLPTALVPVLDFEIGAEVTLRCLSPLPIGSTSHTRVVLAGLEAFLGAAGTRR